MDEFSGTYYSRARGPWNVARRRSNVRRVVGTRELTSISAAREQFERRPCCDETENRAIGLLYSSTSNSRRTTEVI